jgi:cytochrome P450
MLASLMQLHHGKEAKSPPSWMLAIALTNFGAGHDTLMFTLSPLIYHTYTSRSILARLRTYMESQGITKDSRYRDIVQKVPLFLTVLKESMRPWPTIGFFLPRVVPPSGAILSDTRLPAETTVSASLWATYFDPHLSPAHSPLALTVGYPMGLERREPRLVEWKTCGRASGAGAEVVRGSILPRSLLFRLLRGW